ncbi:hypothetical protein Dimus_015371 [Dionaea muscipula]
MVKGSAASSSRIPSSLRNSAASKFCPKTPTPLSLSLFTIFIFGLSISLFLLFSADVFEENQRSDALISNEDQDVAFSNFQSQQLTVKKGLWDTPFSNGLHQCVKPTAKHKGPSTKAVCFSDLYFIPWTSTFRKIIIIEKCYGLVNLNAVMELTFFLVTNLRLHLVQ